MVNASLTAYVRVATPDDFEPITELYHRAFMHDTVFNYFGSHQALLDSATNSQERRKLYNFVGFLTKVCSLLGGRITVAVVPTDAGEEIGAASLWLPPHTRIELWKVVTLVRAGVLPVLRGWGLNGLLRVGVEYGDTCHKAMGAAYKARRPGESPDASWYLQLAGTDPAHQGQGLMSLLIREAYTHAPGVSFTLEATSAKSRDQYAHLGFQLLDEVKLGKGKVGADGLPVDDPKNGTGVSCYVMAKWVS